MRTCSKCGLAKEPADFHRTTGGRLRADCRSCRNAGTRAWRLRAPASYQKAQRRAHLKREYAISPETYDDLLTSQEGVCAICHHTCSTGMRLAVDHDHETGRVRGLLCSACNTGLAKFTDSPARLRTAANYLEQP